MDGQGTFDLKDRGVVGLKNFFGGHLNTFFNWFGVTRRGGHHGVRFVKGEGFFWFPFGANCFGYMYVVARGVFSPVLAPPAA